MPLVEFACGECKKSVELLVRSTSEAQPPPCPACGRGMTRKFSAFNTASASSSPCGAGSPMPSCGAACGGGGGFA